jgi:hypothetical protein
MDRRGGEALNGVDRNPPMLQPEDARKFGEIGGEVAR